MGKQGVKLLYRYYFLLVPRLTGLWIIKKFPNHPRYQPEMFWIPAVIPALSCSFSHRC